MSAVQTSRRAVREHAAMRAAATARAYADGFTLIELMIVLVVVAVLAAIALPAYQAQLRKSARAEAQSFLTDMASRQQQYLVDRRAYAGSVAALNMAEPGSLTGKFSFAVTAPGGATPTFTLTATAAGDQAKDACPVLTIDHAGTRTPASCW